MNCYNYYVTGAESYGKGLTEQLLLIPAEFANVTTSGCDPVPNSLSADIRATEAEIEVSQALTKPLKCKI